MADLFYMTSYRARDGEISNPRPRAAPKTIVEAGLRNFSLWRGYMRNTESAIVGVRGEKLCRERRGVDRAKR